MNVKCQSFFVICCLVLVVLPWSGLGQPAPTTQEIVDQRVAAQQVDKSLFDFYKSGGPWMHPIALCSVAAVAFAVFCAIQVRKSRIMPPNLVSELNNLMSQRQVSQAFKTCESDTSPLGAVMGAALVKASFERDMYNKPAMETAIADAMNVEETKMMNLVNALNYIGQIAPMLGLLGTVVGMIQSFDSLAAGKSEPSDLAAGIGVAMLTTASGLLVAIPSMAAYFYFRTQLLGAMSDMHKTCTRMLDLFTGEMNPDGSRAPTGMTQVIPTDYGVQQ
ncbi:MAG: MotA/TolQ/ExbB proton channel family protein [Verrucomicrobiia bacterium]